MSATKLIETLEDRLPEHVRYRDEGCDLFPSCLNCPFPRCRYDDPVAFQNARRAERNAEVVRLRLEANLSISELAARFDVSKRTVHRILRQGGA